MAKKKVGGEELREVTTIVVEECSKDEQGHYIVIAREGTRYRSKKPVQIRKAYEISPVLSGDKEAGKSADHAPGYYIFSGPLSLRGGAVATTEGKRK